MRTLAVAHNFSCPIFYSGSIYAAAEAVDDPHISALPAPEAVDDAHLQRRGRRRRVRALNDDECVVNLSDEDYVDGAGALEVIDDDAPKLSKASWKLSLSIGREQGTWMPEEWAASGARLLLPITVEFDSVPYPGEPEALVGRTCFRVRPLGDASFVGVGGKVTVPVRGGAWAIQPPKPPQKPALLRFWLEFPEEAKRNDVTLPPGRVFFYRAGLARNRAGERCGGAQGGPGTL